MVVCFCGLSTIIHVDRMHLAKISTRCQIRQSLRSNSESVYFRRKCFFFGKCHSRLWPLDPWLSKSTTIWQPVCWKYFLCFGSNQFSGWGAIEFTIILTPSKSFTTCCRIKVLIANKNIFSTKWSESSVQFLANVNSCSCSLYVVVRPSVVCLSSVCNVRAPYVAELKFSAMFLRHLIRWWPDDIQVKFYGDRPRRTPLSGVKPKSGRKM